MAQGKHPALEMQKWFLFFLFLIMYSLFGVEVKIPSLIFKLLKSKTLVIGDFSHILWDSLTNSVAATFRTHPQFENMATSAAFIQAQQPPLVLW